MCGTGIRGNFDKYSKHRSKSKINSNNEVSTIEQSSKSKIEEVNLKDIEEYK